jgi:hypothetical protein
VDPFGLADADDLADGRWTIGISWRQTSAQEQTVVALQAGTSINIVE